MWAISFCSNFAQDFFQFYTLATMSKTRDLLVEVARQLFAKTGVENTTMNDIAQASEKGRRTLYIYFQSKKAIYQAVIESELNKLYISLQTVAESELPAEQKLLKFIYVRLESIKEVVTRNGTLRADFFRDIWRVENVRKNFDLREIEFIENILKEGVDEGVFDIPDTRTAATVLHHAFKGLEVPYIRGVMGSYWTNKEGKIDNIIRLLFHGILKK